MSSSVHVGLADLVRAIHALRPDEETAAQIAGWLWECTHTGTFNGIPATGKQVRFTGVTIVRVVNGQMVEHWSEVDVVSLLQQLGVMPRPGG